MWVASRVGECNPETRIISVPAFIESVCSSQIVSETSTLTTVAMVGETIEIVRSVYLVVDFNVSKLIKSPCTKLLNL